MEAPTWVGVDEVEEIMLAWVTQTLVRIKWPKLLSIPPYVPSVEGDSKPKINLKYVVNGQRLKIPILTLISPKAWRKTG